MVADKIVSALISRTPEIIAGNGLQAGGGVDPDPRARRRRLYGADQARRSTADAQRPDRFSRRPGRIRATPMWSPPRCANVMKRSASFRSMCRVLGRLDEFTAGYGMVVTPVVGVIPPHCEFLIDLAETSAVASVPICSLMEPSSLCEKCPPLARRSSELSFLCQQWLGCLGRHRAHPRAVSRTGL